LGTRTDGGRSLQPVELRERRFWDARREERAWRASRWLLLAAVVVAAGVGWRFARDWWLVEAWLVGREDRLAEVCADSPFAAAPVVTAGGLPAANEDPSVFAPYLEDVEWTDASARGIADHASLAGDDELALAAATVADLRPHRAPPQTVVVERRCGEHLAGR
jgi:hypothetical protein